MGGINEVELAYIAGIFDGEGCISLPERHYPQTESTYSLVACVSNTNEWLLLYLKSIFGGSISVRNDRNRPCWNWSLRHKKAGEFLKVIYPFLRIKKPQAEVAIRFQDRKRMGMRFLATRESNIALEQAEKILVSSLNKGINKTKGGL